LITRIRPKSTAYLRWAGEAPPSTRVEVGAFASKDFMVDFLAE
jgi:hypothetical protein